MKNILSQLWKLQKLRLVLFWQVVELLVLRYLLKKPLMMQVKFLPVQATAVFGINSPHLSFLNI